MHERLSDTPSIADELAKLEPNRRGEALARLTTQLMAPLQEAVVAQAQGGDVTHETPRTPPMSRTVGELDVTLGTDHYPKAMAYLNDFTYHRAADGTLAPASLTTSRLATQSQSAIPIVEATFNENEASTLMFRWSDSGFVGRLVESPESSALLPLTKYTDGHEQQLDRPGSLTFQPDANGDPTLAFQDTAYPGTKTTYLYDAGVNQFVGPIEDNRRGRGLPSIIDTNVYTGILTECLAIEQKFLGAAALEPTGTR